MANVITRKAIQLVRVFASAALPLLVLFSLPEGASKAQDQSSAQAVTLAHDHYRRGLTYAELKQYDHAAEEFRKALNLSPSFFAPHYSLGQILLRQDKYSESEQSFRAALRIKPDDEKTRAGLIMSLGGQERYAEAEALIEESLRGNKNSEFIYAAKGAIELKAGKIQEAKGSFRRVLEINPDSERIRQILMDLERVEQQTPPKERGTVSAQPPPTGNRWLPGFFGIIAYIGGALATQMLLGLLLGVLNFVGLGAAGLPGVGAKWLSERFGWTTSERFERWNLAFYVATWAGPLYLFTQLILISTQAVAINLYTEHLIKWFPPLAGLFQFMGWIWLYATIGFSGVIAFVVMAWLLKHWLGALGIFWTLFGGMF